MNSQEPVGNCQKCGDPIRPSEGHTLSVRFGFRYHKQCIPPGHRMGGEK